MASSDVLNELIAHFAGYLRLPPGDNYTVKILYQGSAVPETGQADENAKSHAPHHPDLDPMHGAHLNVPTMPAFKPVHLIYSSSHKFQNTDFHSPHPALILPHPLPPLLNAPAGGGGGGGGGGEFQITATYQSGGDETILDIRQINVLSNNNLFINNQQVISATEAYNHNNEHAAKVLGDMLHEANDAIPNGLNLSAANTSSDLQQFVDARDAHPISTLAQDAPFSTQTGQYVNGAPVTDGSDPHQTTDNLLTTVANAEQAGITAPPQAPPGDYQHDHIATVSVGSNYQANDAAIVNEEGLTAQLAVQGNYYQTEAIIQTNVIATSNHVSGGGPGAASIAANTVQNIADMQNDVPTLTSGGSGTTSSGLNWSVTVLNGDLVDVHSLVQTNYLQNNNVVYQTTETGESLTVAGSNIQTNSAEYQNLTSNYQLIIVEGNYNQDDLIYQTNVMLDNNNVSFGGGHHHGGHGGGSSSAAGGGSSSATGGGDSVVNDATIVDTANHNYQAFTPAAQSVVQTLESQSGSVDPASVLSAFPNLFGNINVLVVTGNYYDVNYISQTNIMSNSNVVHMHGGHGATDTVNTGSNIAVNAATIIDGGSALSPYLQGSYYNDMILLQTNIIGNNASAAAHNPGQFVPELVAFTGALDSANQGSEATVAAAASTHHHHDGVAGVMH
jgi:hypothetical protein